MLSNEKTYIYPDVLGSRCETAPIQIITFMSIVVAISGLAMLAFVPFPGAIAAKLTMEKENKMKSLLLVMGMSPHSFWYKILGDKIKSISSLIYLKYYVETFLNLSKFQDFVAVDVRSIFAYIIVIVGFEYAKSSLSKCHFECNFLCWLLASLVLEFRTGIHGQRNVQICQHSKSSDAHRFLPLVRRIFC